MARIKLGELLDSTLTVREQARLISRMRDMLRAEERRQQEHARAGRQRRQGAPAGVKAAQRRQKQQHRLLAVLHTSTDPEQLAAARTELAGQQPTPEEHAPSGQQQHRESRVAAVVSHHAPGRASFWAKLGAAPHCGPGDTATAMVFWRKVQRLLDSGGWTHSERAALLDLNAKWGPRAMGTDARFNIVGTVGGRLPRALELKIKAMQKPGN